MGEYTEMFDASIPRAVQVGLLEMLIQPYQTSALVGSQYPEGTRRKFQPIQLLADVESRTGPRSSLPDSANPLEPQKLTSTSLNRIIGE